jgi:endonuclease/exonuclease/phosphatase family metal-dependent hydrolase
MALLLTVLAAATMTDVRVMSFNVRYGTADDGPHSWPHRKEAVYALLKERKPDVIGLQEALRFQVDSIKANVPGYEDVGVGRDDGKEAGEHSSVLYRPDRFTLVKSETFWFSDTPDVVASRHWGNRITRICTWVHLKDRKSGKAFYVYNVHLDHESQPSRERSSDLLLAKINQRHPKDPVIVTGDFNAGEGNEAVKRLRRAGYLDSFRYAQPEAVNVGTFHAWKGKKTGEKIDYVFVDGTILTLNAEIVYSSPAGPLVSDHFPVVADLRLPAG